MNTFRLLVFSVIGSVSASQMAIADTIIFGAVRDNTLYEDPSGMLSNGAGQFLFAGDNNSGLSRRGLIRFDVAANIPAGATIETATLRLHMSQTPNATNRDVSLQRVLADWGEGASNATAGGGGSGAQALSGDATWIHTFFNTSQWAAAGGDFLATPGATTAVGGVGDYAWTSPQLAADVQGWLNAPATNFGWLLLGDESSTQSVKRFDSRENATVAFRPSLTVEYAPIPEPATFALSSIGFVVLLAIRLRRRNA
jgi:hypothetical protein